MDSKKLKPRNIKENKVLQDSIGAVRQMWSNHLNVLNVSFKNMSREEQCKMITSFCKIITIGVTALVLSLFYQFLPLVVRLPIVCPPFAAPGTMMFNSTAAIIAPANCAIQ